MHVILLHDDVPPDARMDELDVFAQAELVEEGLRALGHSSGRMPFSLDLARASEALSAPRPDLAFNLVEAVGGQGRLIHLATALLDSLSIPYTGAPTEGMFLTSNKVLAKRLLRAHGLPTPDWIHAGGGASPSGPGPGRYIVKSVWEEASFGLEDDAVVEVRGGDALRDLVRSRAPKLGGDAFAERYVEGREFNLSVLGAGEGGDGEVLPPAEIRFEGYEPGRPRVVGYRAKWDADSFEYHHTPRSFDFPREDADLLARLARLARECWALFGLRGWARVDFRVDAQGSPWILEINANPCLSADAGFLAAADRAGLAAADVVRRILEDVPPSTPGRGGERQADVPNSTHL